MNWPLDWPVHLMLDSPKSNHFLQPWCKLALMILGWLWAIDLLFYGLANGRLCYGQAMGWQSESYWLPIGWLLGYLLADHGPAMGYPSAAYGVSICWPRAGLIWPQINALQDSHMLLCTNLVHGCKQYFGLVFVRCSTNPTLFVTLYAQCKHQE